jgi:hypothetical protein
MADSQVVHAPALEAVEAVQDNLASMKAAGDLQPLNRSYRLLRQKRAAAGLKTMPYPVFLRRYSVGLLYKMAAEVRSGAGW